MNDQLILTDATVEAMLVRRAGPGAPDDLVAVIAADLQALPEERRSWRSVLVPSAERGEAFRLAWIVAVTGLVLAATVSAMLVGSQLLRRSDELTVVPHPTLPLTITAHPEGVAALAWNPDGTRLATAGDDGTAKVWDATTGEELLAFTATAPGTMGYSPDGTRIAMAAAVYDAATGDEVVRLADGFLAYSPDGTRIGVGGAWGWAAVIDAATGEELVALPLAPSWMSAMAWSPDGTRIATTWGTSIKVWDAATGDEQLTIDGLVKRTDVVWSPDGTRIAAARDDGRGAKVYRATTGDELATLDPRRFGGVQELEWSPDGARLVTAGHDGTARVWDAAIGAELGTLTGHAGPVNDVAWSPDGTRIATASSDGTARIWQVGSYGPTRWPGPR